MFFVRHVATRPGTTFFLPRAPGAEIHGSVRPLTREQVVRKNRPAPISPRSSRGEGVTDLVICGVMSRMCIDATTRAARDLGYACTVIADACAAWPSAGSRFRPGWCMPRSRRRSTGPAPG